MKITNIISLLLFVLLAFSGCENNIIDIDPPVGAGVNTYSWRTDSLAPLQLEYTIIDTTSNVTKAQLTFVKNSTGEYTINQSINGSVASSMRLINRGDSLSISGLNSHSIIPLPPKYDLSKSQTITVSERRHMKHILAISDDAFVACDDSSNIFFTQKGVQGWTKSQVSTQLAPNSITGFSRYAVNTTAAIVASTTDGMLLVSVNNGKNWIPLQSYKPVGFIGGLFFTGKTLLAAIRGVGIYEITNKGIATKLDGSLPKTGKGDFTSIAPFVALGGRQDSSKIIVGTLSSGLWYYDRDSSITVPFINHSEIGDEITFVVTDNNDFIVGTPTSLHYFTSFDSSKEVIADKGKFIAATVGKGGYILATGDGRVYSYVPLQKLMQEPVLTPRRAIEGIAFDGTMVAVTTDSGVYTHQINTATTWEDSSIGLSIDRKETITIPLFMHLLAVKGLSVGKTWDAGIVEFDHQPLTITATVEDYSDSVKLASGITFPSVFIVKYTLSNTLGVRLDSYPQWTIYYAKNEGPVLIDERLNGKITRAYRSKR